MRPPVVVPLISETTKRTFSQSSHEQQDSTRPVSAVIRSVFSVVCVSIVPMSSVF